MHCRASEFDWHVFSNNENSHEKLFLFYNLCKTIELSCLSFVIRGMRITVLSQAIILQIAKEFQKELSGAMALVFTPPPPSSCEN